MKRLILFLSLILMAMLLSTLFAWTVLASDGASGNSLAVATALVVGWGYLAPLTVYKFIPATDSRMKAITMGFSVLVALVALLVGGDLHPDLSSAAGTYAFALLVYGEQQLVWTLLKDHASTTRAVK